MAEGALGVLLEGEEEAVEPDVFAVVADPVAAAVAVDAARFDPGLSREASDYLRKQGHLVDIQTEHLHEQRAVQLSHLKLRRFTDRLKVGTQLFIILLAALLGVGAVIMLSDAMTSHSVVISSFKAPSALASRGLTGDVVAEGLLDDLTRLQAATHTTLTQPRLASTWADDIKIEVPETGVSIGEIGRLLHERFGRDVHIGGDLVQTDVGGLTLTVRGDGILPKAFAGGPGDLSKLTVQAAEYVYGEYQPGFFGVFLASNSRTDEAIGFAKFHLARANPADRALLLNILGDAIVATAKPNANAQALPLFREAVRLQPDFWPGWENIQYILSNLGDAEGGVRAGRRMIEVAGGRPGRAPEYRYADYDSLIFDLQAFRADTLAGLVARGGAAASAGGVEMLAVVQTDVQLHDTITARLELTTMVWDPHSHGDAAAAATAQAFLAAEVGDLPAAAKAWDDFAAVYADPTVSASDPSGICWAATVYQKTGWPAKADAALNAPMRAVGIGRYVDCYRFRGDVLDLRGDWTGAQDWYARAAALAPSVPSGNYSWGMALARHGDLAGAAAKFVAANQAGPHWADPLKAWGDVLMRQGRAREALAKYDEALKHAPAWAELHRARQVAARKVDVRGRALTPN